MAHAGSWRWELSQGQKRSRSDDTASQGHRRLSGQAVATMISFDVTEARVAGLEFSLALSREAVQD